MKQSITDNIQNSAGKLVPVETAFGNLRPFLQVPDFLLSDPRYRKLSDGAKLLYGGMLSRLRMSARNDAKSRALWRDENGNAYFMYAIEEMEKRYGWCHTTAQHRVQELVDVHLLQRVRQGSNKPNRYYLYMPAVQKNTTAV